MLRMNVDLFVRIKQKHGPLVGYTNNEGDETVINWKKEFGYPEGAFALFFKDGTVWDRLAGLRN